MNISTLSQAFLIVSIVLFGCAGIGLPYNLLPWGAFFYTLSVFLGGKA